MKTGDCLHLDTAIGRPVVRVETLRAVRAVLASRTGTDLPLDGTASADIPDHQRSVSAAEAGEVVPGTVDVAPRDTLPLGVWALPPLRKACQMRCGGSSIPRTVTYRRNIRCPFWSFCLFQCITIRVCFTFDLMEVDGRTLGEGCCSRKQPLFETATHSPSLWEGGRGFTIRRRIGRFELGQYLL